MARDKERFMTVRELAGELGVGQLKVQNWLKQDYRREIPRYPFAIAIPPDEDTVNWTYLIFRERYNRWKSGEIGIEVEIIADAVARCVAEQSQQ